MSTLRENCQSNALDVAKKEGKLLKKAEMSTFHEPKYLTKREKRNDNRPPVRRMKYCSSKKFQLGLGKGGGPVFSPVKKKKGQLR